MRREDGRHPARALGPQRTGQGSAGCDIARTCRRELAGVAVELEVEALTRGRRVR